MTEPARLVDGSRRPTEAGVADFIGRQNAARWADLTLFIETNYPGVFDVEWLFGGKKHGWTLRYKKSKSFCTLVPEQRRFKVLLVFGGAERQKVEGILPALVSHVGPRERRQHEGPLRHRAAAGPQEAAEGGREGKSGWPALSRP
jgi:Protein of unknown function (DUF3788)